MSDGWGEGFFLHLTELRARLIRILVLVALLFCVCFYFSSHLMQWLSLPLYQALPVGSKAVFLDQVGAFFSLTRLSLLAAVLLSLPWVCYQAWAFVAPGLYEHERKFVLPLIFLSILFLFVGIFFAYFFVLPSAYRFFFSFASAHFGSEVFQDLQKYIDFTLSLFFGFGLTFQVPVVQILLVRIGLVSCQQLRSARRYAIVAAFLVAAILTPPDVLSQLMLAIPLCFLYEFGIFCSAFFDKRKDSNLGGGS